MRSTPGGWWEAKGARSHSRVIKTHFLARSQPSFGPTRLENLRLGGGHDVPSCATNDASGPEKN